MTRVSHRIERQTRKITWGRLLTLILSPVTLNAAESFERLAPAYKQLRYDENYQYGPVAVTVEYRIYSAKADEFTAAARRLRAGRLRDGALDWHVLMDIADPCRRVEFFIVESWLEHLRQHERVTRADKELQDHVNSFHNGPEPPRVSHFLFVDNPEAKSPKPNKEL